MVFAFFLPRLHTAHQRDTIAELVLLSFNAVDRHVENGQGESAALIYDSAMTKTKRTLTYRELQKQVSEFAGALANLGVAQGDVVLIYMPMIPEVCDVRCALTLITGSCINARMRAHWCDS